MKKKFQLLINGRNFLLDLEEFKKYGFYSTKFIEAKSSDEAIEMAFNAIRDELKNQVKNKKEDPPEMLVEEIFEVKAFEPNNHSDKGFSFYSEE